MTYAAMIITDDDQYGLEMARLFFNESCLVLDPLIWC